MFLRERSAFARSDLHLRRVTPWEAHPEPSVQQGPEGVSGLFLLSG